MIGTDKANIELIEADAAPGGDDADISKFIWTPDLEPDNTEPLMIWADAVEIRRGELVTFSGKAKSAKSALVQGMVSAGLPDAEGDFLGWSSWDAGGHAVIAIDMEQSRDDWINQTRRLFRRAGTDYKKAPSWLYSLHLRAFTITERWELIERTLKQAAGECGGVAVLLLDGGADLVASVNDEVACKEAVAKLMKIAETFNCVVAIVVHTNEGANSDPTKVRGHFGSDCIRKSENVLTLKKDASGTTAAWSSVHRKGGVPEHMAFKYAWSDVDSMHVSTPDAIDPKLADALAKYGPLMDELFSDGERKRNKDILDCIMSKGQVKERTAKDAISSLRKAGKIKQPDGKGTPYALGN